MEVEDIVVRLGDVEILELEARDLVVRLGSAELERGGTERRKIRIWVR